MKTKEEQDDELIIEIIDDEEDIQDELSTDNDEEKETKDKVEDEDDEPEELEDEPEAKPSKKEEKADKSTRSERRIRQLVARAKAAEDERDRVSAEKEDLVAKNKELKTQQTVSNDRAMTEAKARVKAQESEAVSSLKAAKEDGNIDAEVKATEALANIASQKQMIQNYESRKKGQAEQTETEELAEKPVRKQQPRRKDPHAEAWVDRNEWFNGDSIRHAAMTQAAVTINNALIAESYKPDADGHEEFYTELDARMKEEFPEEFKQKRVRKQSVAGGTRTASTPKGNKVRLTKRQVALAGRMGLTKEEYAVELHKIERSK